MILAVTEHSVLTEMSELLRYYLVRELVSQAGVAPTEIQITWACRDGRWLPEFGFQFPSAALVDHGKVKLAAKTVMFLNREMIGERMQHLNDRRA